MNLLTNFRDHDAMIGEETKKAITVEHLMEHTIDNLPIKDKENLIGLIDHRREDGGVINYGSQESEDKWAPIHDFIRQNPMVYLYRLSKDVLAEKANFANEYNNKKVIEFIDKLLNGEDNEVRSYLQTKDKDQQKKYSMIVNFYNQPKELQAIRQVFEKAIEGKAIKKKEIIQIRNHTKNYTKDYKKQKSIQNSQAKDLKKKLLG